MKTQAITIVLACAAGLFGAGLPRFEVATLKQAPPPQGDSYNITLGAIKGDRLYPTNVTLNDCVKFAYDLVSDDQISGPDWIRSKALLTTSSPLCRRIRRMSRWRR